MLGVGSVIGGRFRIDRVLGSGGMGVVFAATHLELNHRVAIKLLHDEMAESPVIVERFLREARAVVGLRTEHVCRVTDVGRLDTGAPYIVMEMLDGVDLQRTVARSPLPLTTAVEYVLQACVALAEAHAAGIIHRDLKPANLFVTRRHNGGPLVKVLDFGIAKALTETGAHLTQQSAMGSPGYMSPEQIQSARDVDARTDIWALGVTLYQLLSTRLPFGGTNVTEIAIAVATEPPAPLDVDPRLHAVIWKCLQKRPSDRYANCGELMTALAPFGGPSARSHVGNAAHLGGAARFEPPGVTTGPSVIVPSQPTQATQTPALKPRPRLTPPQLAPLRSTGVMAIPRKRRTALIALLVLVVIGFAAGGWITIRAQDHPVAAPDTVTIAAIEVDARSVPTIDAPTSQPASDPWGTPADPPVVDAGVVAAVVDAGVDAKRSKTPRTHDVWGSVAQVTAQLSDKEWIKQCPHLTHGPGANMMPVGMRLHCACLTKDQKLAEQLLNAVDDGDRAGVRAHCKQYGVVLP